MRIRNNFFQRTIIPLSFCQFEEPGEGGGGGESVKENLTKAFADKLEDGVIIPEVEEEVGIKLEGEETPAAEVTKDKDGNTIKKENIEQDIQDEYWAEFKERVHTEDKPYELPKEILTGKKEDGTPLSKKEKFDILLDHIYKNTTFDNQDDEFIKSYRVARQDKDFDFNKFINETGQKNSVLNLEGKEFMTAMLKQEKNKDGGQKYTDKDIEDYIGKLTPIELDQKANELKASYKKQNEQFLNQQKESITAKQQEEFNKWEANRKKEVEQVTKEFEKLDNIGGLPISEADRKIFNPIFDKLTQHNPETGQLFMDDYLQSDNKSLYKALYVLHKIDTDGISKYIGELKNNLKSETLKKLNIKPNILNESNQQEFGEPAPKSSDFH